MHGHYGHPYGHNGQPPQDGGQGGPVPIQVVAAPGAPPHAIVSSFVPQFPQLASTVDHYARRFPWYLWLLAGVVGMYYAQKRGLWKEIAMKLGTK